jgi:hypothetical protein
MPAETQLAKATFTVQGGGSRPLEVQFNPVSLEHTIANQLQGEGGQAAQHVASSSAKLTMELVFDTTDTGADVRTKTNPVANLMKPAGGESEDAAERGAPPIVVFEWGAYRFQGMVESFKETIDYFSANGVPLRATVSLTLNSQEHVFEAMGDTGRTAGVGGGLELPGGDPSSVAAAGGVPEAARAIASANGLESLRFGTGAGLSVGGGVTIKPPASFAAGGGAGAGFGLGLGVGASVSAGPVGGQMSAGISATAGAFAALGQAPPAASLADLDPRRLLGEAGPPAPRAGAQFDLSGRALLSGPSGFQAKVNPGLRFDEP